MVYQDGGWRVLVNGEARPPEREPGVFLAAELPAGKSRVDVLYRPAGFLWGCVIAALGLAVGAAAAGTRPYSPSRPASACSALITFSMCSSSGRPISSAPS